MEWISYPLQILLIIELKVIISNDPGATKGTIRNPRAAQHAIGIFFLPNGNPNTLPQPIGPVMKLPLSFLHIQFQNPEPGQPSINHIRQLIEATPIIESMPIVITAVQNSEGKVVDLREF